MNNRISELRELKGLSQVKLAELVGTSGQMIGMLEAGKRGLTLKWMHRIAAALNVDPVELISNKDEVRRIDVVGAAEAGIWSEPGEWPGLRRHSINVPVVPLYNKKTIYAIDVVGSSMDKAYPDGSIVVCVPVSELENPAPEEGRRYIVRRFRPDGEYEVSIKEYATHPDGKPRMWPRSTQPGFRTPLPLGDGEDETVRLEALVIGSYIPE